MSQTKQSLDVLGLAKLAETISNGIGNFYEPTRIKKIGSAKADNIREISKAIKESPDIPILYEQDGIKIQSQEMKDLSNRAYSRLAYQETVKQHNIESITAHAANEFDEDEQVTSEKVEQDWILRFIDSVENITDSHLQKIWGKILAGEIKEPTKYSFRTLNILKNISKKEAHLFKNISQFILSGSLQNGSSNDNFLYGDSDFNSKYDIHLADLLLLEECGLLNTNHLVRKLDFADSKENKKKVALFYRSKYIFVLSSDSSEILDEQIDIPAMKLTNAGNDIFNIIEPTVTVNDEYALDVFKKIADNYSNENYEVGIHLINKIYEDLSIGYKSNNLLKE